ncbi:hypothetical protein QOT17_010537 [Balamuthia mandrillaris]
MRQGWRLVVISVLLCLALKVHADCDETDPSFQILNEEEPVLTISPNGTVVRTCGGVNLCNPYREDASCPTSQCLLGYNLFGKCVAVLEDDETDCSTDSAARDAEVNDGCCTAGVCKQKLITPPNEVMDENKEFDLFLDEDDLPAFFYQDDAGCGDDPGPVKFIRCADSACDTLALDTTISGTEQAFCPVKGALDPATGNPVFVVYGNSPLVLFYVHCDDPDCDSYGFQNWTIANYDNGYEQPFAVGFDVNENPYIAYWDDDDVYYRSCTDVTCGVETRTLVANNLGGSWVQGVVVAIRSDGRPMVVTNEGSGRRVVFWSCHDETCSTPPSQGWEITGDDVDEAENMAVVVGKDDLVLACWKSEEGTLVSHCDDYNCTSGSLSNVGKLIGGNFACDIVLGENDEYPTLFLGAQQGMFMAFCTDYECSDPIIRQVAKVKRKSKGQFVKNSDDVITAMYWTAGDATYAGVYDCDQ